MRLSPGRAVQFRQVNVKRKDGALAGLMPALAQSRSVVRGPALIECDEFARKSYGSW